MKRLICLLLVLAAPTLAQNVKLPASSRDTLDNGLTVILMPYAKVPVVHFRLIVRGGSASDPAGHEGLAAMTTSLMREGTATRTAEQIARSIDFVGGSLSVDAGLDYCAATTEVLSKDVDTALALLSDVVLAPSFPEEELERERKQRLAGLDAMKEEPAAVVSLVFSRSVYGSHPYGAQRNGTRRSIGEVTQADLRRFHASTFVPQNAVLAVVGDFAPGDMMTRVRNAFSAWRRGEAPAVALDRPVPLTGRRVVLIDKPDATQTQIRFGNTGIDIRDPDYFPVMVANTVFGSGFTSRLIEELRVKRSLTYSASSSFPAALHGGSFGIGTFTKNATMGEALDVIIAELKKYRTSGATNDEIEKAKNYITGNFARSLQTPGALAQRVTDIEVYGLPPDHFATYVEKVGRVTQKSLKEAVTRHFTVDDRVIVLLGPARDLRALAAPYGEVSVIPLDEAVR